MERRRGKAGRDAGAVVSEVIGSWRMQGGMAAGNEKLKAEAAAPAKVIAGAALCVWRDAFEFDP